MVENLITVEGYADDLLDISQSGETKMTRLFYLFPENDYENCETFDISIISTNPYKEFPVFDKMSGKKIRITVDVVE